MSKSKKIKPMTMKDELAEFSDEMERTFDMNDPATAEAFRLQNEQRRKPFKRFLRTVGWIVWILFSIAGWYMFFSIL